MRYIPQPEVKDFTSVPPGTYIVQIVEVRYGVARDGSPRWSLRFEVADASYTGETPGFGAVEAGYIGRTAGWGSLTWNERGMRDVGKLLSALGHDTSREFEIEGPDIHGCFLRMTFERTERVDELTARRSIRLEPNWSTAQKA